MSTEESGSLARVEELPESECLDLLGTKQVGRVAYSDPEGPVVIPVNYVLHDGMVLFRVAPYSQLADRLRDGAASFQVDHVDEDARTGWSVLVRGHAARVNSWELPEADSRPTPWAAGGRNLHVRLSPHQISGVRLVDE
jgi:nitroimidazol reductase NimA-like FMN-containing flavoprotein (pyridoxamine 5'-phosphate oxidase superfamily)